MGTASAMETAVSLLRVQVETCLPPAVQRPQGAESALPRWQAVSLQPAGSEHLELLLEGGRAFPGNRRLPSRL